MNKYIAIDTETGGIGEEADLLTAYFGILDEDFNITAELSIKLRPDTENDFYHVAAKALEINKIDLIKHFKDGKDKSHSGAELRNFLIDNVKWIEGKVQRLIPIGHNIAFDIRKVSEKLLNKTVLDQYIGYRVLDTGTLGQFFQAAGLIPKEVSAGLGNLLKHYGLEFQGEAHSERADALACVDIIKAMLKQVAPKKPLFATSEEYFAHAVKELEENPEE